MAWMFDRKGLLVLEREGQDEDEVMLQALEAGADDVIVNEDVFEITTDPTVFAQVKQDLESGGMRFLGAEISWIPKSLVPITAEQEASITKLIDALEELDEVQDVYTNYEVEE